MKKNILLILLCVIGISAFAQTSQKDSAILAGMNMLDDKIMTDNMAQEINMLCSFILPPIEELYERAKNAPMLKSVAADINYAERDLKTERRRWMEWFKASASYSYGIANNYMYYTESGAIPSADKYTNQAQNYFLLGGTVAVSLHSLLNYRNVVKQRRAVVIKETDRYNQTYDEVRKQVTEAYINVQNCLYTLTHTIEMIKLAEAQYESSKVDFAAGKLDVLSLFERKERVMKAVGMFTDLSANIKMGIFTLEYLTGTDLLTKNN